MRTTRGTGRRRLIRWVCGGAVCLLLAMYAMLVVTGGNGGNVAAQTQFRVRVLLAVPDAPGLDVWIDDRQLAANSPFRTVTAYRADTPGDYNLRVFPPGTTTRSRAFVDTSFRFEQPKDYTIVVRGRQSDNSIRTTVEIDRNTLDPASARLRFGNDIVGAAQVTLAIAGSNTVLGRANFGETDEYIAVPPGTQEIFINDGSGPLARGSITLAANTVVSVFAVGIKGGTDTATTPALLFVQDNPAGAMPTVLTAATATPAIPPTITPAPIFTVAPPPVPIAPPTPTPAGSPALRQALRPVPAVADTPTKVFYAATGHTLGGPFKRYWEAKGGLEQFGYPISEEYMEMSPTDGRIRTVQYFERARFELHPDRAGTPFEVQQGLLGREILKLFGV